MQLNSFTRATGSASSSVAYSGGTVATTSLGMSFCISVSLPAPWA